MAGESVRVAGGCALLVEVFHVVVIMVKRHAAALPRRAFDGIGECVFLGVVEGVGVEALTAAAAALGWRCVDGGGVGRRETLPLLVICYHVFQLHGAARVGCSVRHVTAHNTP